MMYHRAGLYISLVLAAIILTANGDTSVCTGYPKTFNGLPCASTTRYWDGQMGACGCGTGDTSPFAWQYTKITAAGSPPIFGTGTWCGSGCGTCYKLTPTAIGASVVGTGAPNTNSVVIKVTNLCPPDGNANWCSYDVNSYGYDAHFDLMDYNMDGLISSMGWNNPEVTYQEVDCASNGFADWGCQCADSAVAATVNSTSSSTSTTTSSSSVSSPTKSPAATAAADVDPTKAPKKHPK